MTARRRPLGTPPPVALGYLGTIAAPGDAVERAIPRDVLEAAATVISAAMQSVTVAPVAPRARARQGEGALSDAIREALALEAGLVIWRNSVGSFHAHGGGRVWAGLPRGSADLVGVLAVEVALITNGEHMASRMRIGRWLALEVKRPGEIPTSAQIERIEAKLGMPARSVWRVAEAGKMLALALKSLAEADRHVLEQERFMADVRRVGGFAAYVDSPASARAAVARARTGACQ